MSKILTLHDLGCNTRRLYLHRAYGSHHSAACEVFAAGCCGTRDCGPPKTKCKLHPLRALPAEEGLSSILSSDLLSFRLPSKVGNCIVSGRTPEDKIRSLVRFARGRKMDPSHFLQDLLQQYSTPARVAERVSQRISEIVPIGKFLELCAGNAVLSAFLCLDGHSGTGVEIDKACKGKQLGEFLSLDIDSGGRMGTGASPGSYQHIEGSALDLSRVVGDFDFSVMSPPPKRVTDFILSALSRTNLVFVLIPTHQEKERLVGGGLKRVMEELPHTFYIEWLCRQKKIGCLVVDTFLEKSAGSAWHLEDGVDSFVTLYMLFNKCEERVVTAGQFIEGKPSQDGLYEKDLADQSSLSGIGRFIVNRSCSSVRDYREVPPRELAVVPISLVERPSDGYDAFSAAVPSSQPAHDGDLLIQGAFRADTHYVTTYSNGIDSFHLETALAPAPTASSCSYRKESKVQVLDFCGKKLQGTLHQT